MSWLEFWSELIGDVLSWPVLFFVVVLVFQRPIRELLGRIKSYEGLGQKLTFSERVARAAAVVDDAVKSVAPLSTGAEPRHEEPDPFWRKVTEDAELGPADAVKAAWEYLEAQLSELEERADSDDADVADELGASEPNPWLKVRRDDNALPPDFVQAVVELQSLHQLAQSEDRPGPGDAIAYIDSVKDMSNAVQSLAESERRRS